MTRPGLLLINKPAGITSFQFLSPIKKKFDTKKVGHAGTLDKFAEGLMLILLGQGTRFVQYLTGLDKSYRAELKLGAETDTLDPEGRIIARAALPDRDVLAARLALFRGESCQTPPAFSAIHLDGKRAYQRALGGEKFDIPSRKIHISLLRMINYTGFHAEIEVKCSKGTYIRSLARDLAREAQSRAFLTALYRTGVGGFKSGDAMDLDDFLALSHAEAEEQLIWGSRLLSAIPGMQSVRVREALKKGIGNGRAIALSDLDMPPGAMGSAPIALLSESDEILALTEPQIQDGVLSDQLKYLSVFHTN